MTSEIPPRLPGESPGDYLKRLKNFEDEIHQIERIKKDLNKTLKRRRARIDSITERVILEKEIRRALRDPPRKGMPNRFYGIPDKPGVLCIFLPLFLLISLIWQNITHTDTRFNQGRAISGRSGRYEED